ncbi:MAG TPA: PfkB family carbohydrate kinase [Candidatus Glassbacteria bacterium]|nr:PfkB family carbohydrate kinase [Candidatus Glassbacteria bacterium]
MVVKKPEPVVVVGTVALDTVETPYGKAQDVVGGSGAFFALGASLLAPVKLVSIVGQDFSHWEDFDRPDIDLEGVKRTDGKTFRWGGKYRENINLRDTLFTELGVIAGYVPELPESYRSCRTVCLANIDPPVQLRVLEGLERPEFVVADTMNYWIQTQREALAEVIRRSHVLILNDEEARQLTGRLNLFDAVEDIQQRGPAAVVVKKGEHGVVVAMDGEYFAAPAYPLRRVVDPTGAGDCFAAGFVGYLQRAGEHTPRAMRSAAAYGTALASFCCEDFSIWRIRKLTLAELEERVENFRRLVHFD